ncbi:MAG: adenylyl-sulfate kinase [Aliiglaciecola sp.]|uniref:adenylyl-sulfate kinase n=1 Tax=Aliiglaciecola sp. M165 TaxID=2593649 RepID=UPI00117C4385|nr:adenylyl-sulfate kinase [Aliiglaciecola sp. M165]TRY29353.1 adenylyl-sulfate kinase [Aliiglaciecola sp. M165]
MATNIVWHQHDVDKKRRAQAKNQKPAVIWLTGLSGSGKSTIANLLEKKLAEAGKHTYLLDGDNVRHGLCGDLGFSNSDRVENIRRISEVAKLFVDAGTIVLTAFISPFKTDRDFCRSLLGDNEFIEVFVDTPLEECEKRDPKGLYQKARQGDIKDFTGIDSSYEAPESAEITLTFNGQTPEQSAEELFAMLQEKGYLDK